MSVSPAQTGKQNPANRRAEPMTGGGNADVIKVWASVGFITLVVVVSGIIRWLFSDDFVPTAVGSDPYAYFTYLRIVELCSAIFLLYFFVTCVVIPYRRERRFVFDGKLLIGCLAVHFVDPLFNYFSPAFIQNAHAINWGSWANFIPGYASPSGDAGYVEGLLWAAALYGLFGIAAAKAGGWALGKLRARYVGISNIAAYGVLFAVCFVGDFLIEYYLFVREEIYIFWGAWSPFTLWAGEVTQFPLYECLLATVYALGFVWIRDSRDDEGYSVVERGVNKLKLSLSWRSFVSFCAVVGFSLTWSMVSYFGPFWYISMQADSFPDLPSYLEGGAFCGHQARPEPCPAQYLKTQDKTYKVIYSD